MLDKNENAVEGVQRGGKWLAGTTFRRKLERTEKKNGIKKRERRAAALCTGPPHSVHRGKGE